MIQENFFNAMHFIFYGLLLLFKMYFKILLYKKSNKKMIIFEKKMIKTRIFYLYSLLIYKLKISKKIN